MALTLTRKEGERITLTLPDGQVIIIEVGQISLTRTQVKVRIDAPQTVKIERGDKP